jgi:hypothetical protein
MNYEIMDLPIIGVHQHRPAIPAAKIYSVIAGHKNRRRV